MPKVHRALRPKRPSFLCRRYDFTGEAPFWGTNTPEWYFLARALLSDRAFAEQYFGHFIHKELTKGGLLHEIV